MIWLVCAPEIGKEEISQFENFADAIAKKQDDVCLICKKEQLIGFKKGIPHLCYEPNNIETLGTIGGASYGISRLLYEKNKNLPDWIVFSTYDALSYYSLIALWTDKELFISNVKISIAPNPHSDNKKKEIDYRFPNYMLDQLVLFCEAAADAQFDFELKKMQSLNSYQCKRKTTSDFPFPQQSVSQIENAKGSSRKLSIVIPFYNLGESLPQTLKSVFSSDYLNREILLLDDGSNEDFSLDILSSMQKKYPELKTYTLPHKGLNVLRNEAVKLAKGEYITFLDADDMVEPDYYSKAIDVLDYYTNVAFVCSWVRFFEGMERIEPFFNTTLPLLLLRNTHTSFSVSRREIYEKFAYNKPEMKNGFEDHEAWISMAEKGFYGVCLPLPLCHYRIRVGSLSNQYTTKKRENLYRLMVQLHPLLYKKYNANLLALLQANGPAQIWTSPLLSHRDAVYEGQGYLFDMQQEELRIAKETLNDSHAQIENWKHECTKLHDLTTFLQLENKKNQNLLDECQQKTEYLNTSWVYLILKKLRILR